MDEKIKVRNFILENYMIGENEEDLNDDGSFLENGIIDSTGVLELVMFVEETFGIEVEDHEVIPDNLDSINKLYEYISKKMAQKVPV